MITQAASELLECLAAEGVVAWMTGDVRDSLPKREFGRLIDSGKWFGETLRHHAESPSLVRRACDDFRKTYEETGARDGYVSVPLRPAPGDDAQALVDAARSMRREVGRPNLLVQLPATDAGISAYQECLTRGIGVNSTGILSVERYRRVLDAHLTGTERALEDGVHLHDITAVTSLPVGILDAEVNRELDLSSSAEAVANRNRAGTAVARLVYRQRETYLSGDWWRVLRTAGARPPRLMWTDLRAWHVPALVGWNTAQAVSPSVLESAAARHCLRGDNLLNTHLRANRTVRTLRALGSDPELVARSLEPHCGPRRHGGDTGAVPENSVQHP
ncbi:hypothetical protein CDG81_16890 [Actinopolyspora erythraea]|uniref:Transaldolase n=1 Tax=Actinopolyspora erythraea TaxID=414996 RepID=A0A223RUU5_9ACTN|nr:transaldolase family protein [Actinopolyspora erythraea]ASU79666.1 hypothetical protein CDG81_16890 [Actinopolyspora erythraea]